MKLSELLKREYRKAADSRVTASCFFFGYFLVQKIRNRECRKSYKKQIFEKRAIKVKESLDKLCVAAICDDMTWQNLKQECQAYSLTPHNWKSVFKDKQPDVFFCESAWVGIKEQGNCWHGKVYKNNRLLFENRKDLLEILQFCRQNKIPTVFWNKEDPAFFNSEKYDFKDTALQFDYIFTTAKECVEGYQAQGHAHVDVMPFGFSPYLFNPLNSFPKEEQAVFAGSWFGEEKERCKDLKAIFDEMIAKDITLVIYDRQTGNTKEGRSFPEQYQKYVHPAVPFEKLGQILKKSKYAINVNTIVTSETMFARRVLEFMAMNTVVISNHSLGMKQLFQDRVWFAGEAFSEESIEEKCLKNLEYVFTERTNRRLLTEAFEKVGVLKKSSPKRVAIFAKGIEQSNTEEYEYGFFWDGESSMPDFETLLPHFCYLPSGCGIKVSAGREFAIQENKDNTNVLFPKEVCCQLFAQPELSTQKYYLGVSTK